MGKIVVRIVSDGANVSGGLADSKMLLPYAADVVRDTDYVGKICGGALPITQTEYNKLGLPVTDNLAAWYRFGQGITDSSGAVSQWDDQSGNGRHLTQATATNQPAKQADGSILFDGVDNYLKTDAFTLGIPYSVYLLAKQVTWTNSDYWFDGRTSNSFLVVQVGSSPQVKAGDAALGTTTVSPALDTYVVLSATQNASKAATLKVNLGTAVTGTLSGTAMAGFTLGANAGASVFGNIQIKEVILYSSVLSTDQDAAVIRYLSGVGGLGL